MIYNLPSEWKAVDEARRDDQSSPIWIKIFTEYGEWYGVLDKLDCIGTELEHRNCEKCKILANQERRRGPPSMMQTMQTKAHENRSRASSPPLLEMPPLSAQQESCGRT